VTVAAIEGAFGVRPAAAGCRYSQRKQACALQSEATEKKVSVAVVAGRHGDEGGMRYIKR
ncbi:MAG: hypothetical protein KGM47_19130, partial [Acidobacteriota bacterium]|nr:hypothetical protein [Acidobacteriota bacterium]